MKIHLKPSLLPVAALLLATALAASAARAADQPETTAIKFSDPAKPGTLRITLAMGAIKVTGADTAELTVRTDLVPEPTKPRADGMRVLSESTTFSLTEKDNIVMLEADQEMNSGGRESTFAITIPRSTSVVIRNSLGGEIEVSDITGNIEIKSLNGEVTLTNVTAGALVETMNGGITSHVRTLSEGKPLSFTSMNGEIALDVPADTKANVRLRTQNGAILTDFDDQTLVTKTESVRGHRKPGHITVNFGAKETNTSEIHDAVREAVRVGIEAAHEAASAMREAAMAAREAAQEARNQQAETQAGGPIAPLPPVPPLPPMTGGKLVSGTLNGGGAEIRATAMNGDVILRKAK